MIAGYVLADAGTSYLVDNDPAAIAADVPGQPADHVPEVGRATATVNDPLPLPVVRS